MVMRKFLLGSLMLINLWSSATGSDLSSVVFTASEQSVIEQAQQQKGLIMLLECEDVELMESLARLDGAIVENVRSDIKRIGKVPEVKGVHESQWNGIQIPSITNNVNLLIVSESAAVQQSEIARVLVSGGVALYKGKKLTKPQNTETD